MGLMVIMGNGANVHTWLKGYSVPPVYQQLH